MPLIAHLTADAASFSFHPADGGPAASVETPFHRLVILVEDEAGTILRSIEHFADGRLDVRGEGEAPHEASGKPDEAEASSDAPAATPEVINLPLLSVDTTEHDAGFSDGIRRMRAAGLTDALVGAYLVAGQAAQMRHVTLDDLWNTVEPPVTDQEREAAEKGYAPQESDAPSDAAPPAEGYAGFSQHADEVQG